MAEESRFETFDLTLNLGPGKTPWISAASRIGLLHGIPRADRNLMPLDDLLDLVHDYRDAVQFAESSSVSELSTALGQLVFGESQILELFQATRGVAADRGKQTLVRILASPHLATLPWELLPDPGARSTRDRTGFLTLSPDAHVVRMARARSYASRERQLKPPLNLLIVLSSPSPLKSSEDSLAFDIYEVRRSLLAELQPLINEGLLHVEIEDRPTIENLRRKVGGVARGFQLFHYVGHALPNALVLEDASGRRENQDSAQIAEILRLCPDLRLAVFAGCETARASTEAADVDVRLATGWRDLVSLADRCVQDACPLVIGMQAVLPFRTERLFTRFFYQGVASGYSIAEALQLARGAARSDVRVAANLLDWSVPALFIGSGEPGPIIERNAKAERPPPPARSELRIAQRQSETRFFARDLPLRQAVDVLATRTPEKVLIVTGAAGVGKSSLIDRALEEVGESASHVLYLKLGRLAPELEAMLPGVRNNTKDWDKNLERITAEGVLLTLCKLVSELLSQRDGIRRPQGALKPQEWWEQLAEQLVRARFVMVIDDMELFDDLIEAALKNWMEPLIENAFINGKRKRSLAKRIELLEGVLKIMRSSKQRVPNECKQLLLNVSRQLFPADSPESDWVDSAARRVFEPLILDRIEREGPNGGRARSKHKAQLSAKRVVPFTKKVGAVRQALEAALRQIAERRSGSRIALITALAGTDFLHLPPSERFELRLGNITWQETWRWIRRNLPGLTRYSDFDLGRIWPRFGPNLELWETLERQILSAGRSGKTLAGLVSEISPPVSSSTTFYFGERRGRRPLRLAIAGNLAISNTEAFPELLSRIANEYGIGGRVGARTYNTATTLAELVGPPSPFSKGTTVTSAQIEEWLRQAIQERPDIVLLDYGGYEQAEGYELRPSKQQKLLDDAAQRCLLIAAAGNGGPHLITVPAIYPQTFAIGALDEEEQLRDFSGWFPKFQKPDLFMKDNLRGAFSSALELGSEDRMEGTSFAAFHATVAALLVWSLIPDLRPTEVRDLMMSSSCPLYESDAHSNSGPRKTTLKRVVDAARMRLIESMLSTGPCLPESLAAIAGQDTVYMRETLQRMEDEKRVVRILTGRIEQYQLNGTGKD